MPVADEVNRIFREFRRYTGDGLPGEPVGAPLPVGDPQSGVHSPKKADIRTVVAAAVTAAETAADRAEDAAEAAESVSDAFARPASRAALKALNTSNITTAYLSEVGREGVFSWRTGDYTARIAADTLEGMFIKATAIAASVGAWVRATGPQVAYDLSWWGPNKNGVTNDAGVFNCASAVVSLLGGGTIRVGAGTYFISATITSYDKVFWEGAGGTSTVLKRTGSYGDTWTQTGGFAKVRGFYFMHGTMYAEGNTSLDFKLTDGSAHIRLVNTQNAEISGNIIWRMPYPVVCDGAHNPKITGNWIVSVWDHLYTAAQEGLADLAFIGSTRYGQLAKVTQNYFSGWYGGLRSYTYTDGTTSAVVNKGANVGSQSCILATSIEDLDVQENYFGRASSSLVRLALTAATYDILIDIRISGNFFDNAGQAQNSRQILAQSTSSGKRILGLNITSNTFNGETDTDRAIFIPANTGDSGASVVNLTMNDNTMFAHTASPILLQGVQGGTVSGNTIQNYNCVQAAVGAGTNATYKSGVYVGGSCDNVHVTGNQIGGGGNNADPTASNYCYLGVTIESAAGKNNYANDNTYSLVTSAGAAKRGLAVMENQVVRTAAGNYQMVAQDMVVVVNKTTGAATSVGLPINPVVGQEAVVKDGKGDAATNNVIVITADGTLIDNAANTTINTAYGSRRLRFNGSGWNVV